MVYHRILNIVSCAIEKDLVIQSIYNSLHLLMPSLLTPSPLATMNLLYVSHTPKFDEAKHFLHLALEPLVAPTHYISRVHSPHTPLAKFVSCFKNWFYDAPLQLLTVLFNSSQPPAFSNNEVANTGHENHIKSIPLSMFSMFSYKHDICFWKVRKWLFFSQPAYPQVSCISPCRRCPSRALGLWLSHAGWQYHRTAPTK